MSKTRGLRFLTLAVAAGGLAGACTPGRVDYVHVDSSYMPIQYATVPYSKAMRADVSGNPFNIPQEDFNRLVNEAIQPSGVQPSDSSPYVVHFAFGNSATNVNYACAATGQTGHGGGTIAVTAAFCRGPGAALTYLVGSVDGITGPDDPRFRKFLRSIVARLFPDRTEDSRNDNRNCFMFGC